LTHTGLFVEDFYFRQKVMIWVTIATFK